MKQILSLALMIIIPFSLFAQVYLNYLPKEKNESQLTFYDHQEAFNK